MSVTDGEAHTHTESGEEKEGEGKVLQRRRALYQFDARNHDEVSFMPGDIIEVSPRISGRRFRGKDASVNAHKQLVKVAPLLIPQLCV